MTFVSASGGLKKRSQDWSGKALPRPAVGVLLFTFVAAAFAAVGLFRQPPATAHTLITRCGVERWAVKTLADADARRVNFRARDTTISALRRLTPTRTYSRGVGVERTTYRIKARLVEAKLEDDQDFHLVVADPRHRSRRMIVEFPASNCTRRSLKRKVIRRARAAFVRSCGIPSSSYFMHLRGRATITGVGFFDFDHGQRGIAPNGIELHPVLSYSEA